MNPFTRFMRILASALDMIAQNPFSRRDFNQEDDAEEALTTSHGQHIRTNHGAGLEYVPKSWI